MPSTERTELRHMDDDERRKRTSVYCFKLRKNFNRRHVRQPCVYVSARRESNIHKHESCLLGCLLSHTRPSISLSASVPPSVSSSRSLQTLQQRCNSGRPEQTRRMKGPCVVLNLTLKWGSRAVEQREALKGQ